jgi:hypothetical protein
LLFQELGLAANPGNGVSWVFAGAPDLRSRVSGCVYNLAVDAVHGVVELLCSVYWIFEIKVAFRNVLLHYSPTNDGYRNCQTIMSKLFFSHQIGREYQVACSTDAKLTFLRLKTL